MPWCHNVNFSASARSTQTGPTPCCTSPVRAAGRSSLVKYSQIDENQNLDTDDDRPSLFGQAFDGPMEGHFPDQPIHNDLHVWLWRTNPAGLFAQFNPALNCSREQIRPSVLRDRRPGLAGLRGTTDQGPMTCDRQRAPSTWDGQRPPEPA